MWISIPLFMFLGLLTIPLPLKLRYRFIRLWSKQQLWWLKVLCNIDYQVTGLENIPDAAAIILCKHQSTWETLALQSIFPHQVWVLKRSLLWVPFFGWGLALLKPIAIDRQGGRKSLKQLVEQGVEHMQQGRWIVVFPEGTRVAFGSTGEYHIGGAFLAQQSAKPVVPVTHNAGKFWGKRKFIKQPGTIQVHIGKPINTAGRKAKEINQEVKEWIEGEKL